MIRFWFAILVLPALVEVSGHSASDDVAERRWFETRTAHFNVFSCGATQDVARAVGRLEQFREAYSLLAGAQAVASPPIVVLAFPDQDTLKPFLPLYQGKAANLSGFFHRDMDENLIVLSLSAGGSMETIFHEYNHLLFRHNERFWPVWLKEGMAEIYSTFELTGERGVRIGKPLPRHLQLLEKGAFMPLKQLLAVDHDSPEYNEREHQGIFYAESWLLTHYLMLGDHAANRARFGQLTTLLKQGQSSEQAFTNAFLVPLSAMEANLRRYVTNSRFESLSFTVAAGAFASVARSTRYLSPAETNFRLGSELLRIGRYEDAEGYFMQTRKLTPAGPLSYEGLGLIAARRKNPKEAVENLGEALRRGSPDFLAHYVYARSRLQLTENGQGKYFTLEKSIADDIRLKLKKSLALMPDFGPAHHLLGFLELLQGEDFAAAEQHLKRAIQLEPENESYQLSLAQAQWRQHDNAAARRTLEALRHPYVEPGLRIQAEELLGQIPKEDKNTLN